MSEGGNRIIQAAKWFGAKAGHIGIYIVLGAALALAIIFGINLVNTQKPVLGLRFEGHNIGELFSGDARAEVAALVQEHETAVFAVQAAGFTDSVSLRQLGAQANTDKVYEALTRVGRSGNPLVILVFQVKAPVGAMNTTLAPPLDDKLVSDYLTLVDQQIAVAPVDAAFVWGGARAVIRSDTAGSALDREASVHALRHADVRSDAPVQLPLKSVPAGITTTTLELLLPEVRRVAEKPLTIGAGESKITLTPEQLVGLVVPKLVPDPQDASRQIVQLTFDEGKIKGAVDEVLKQAVVAPQPTIMQGKKVVRQGTSGRQAEHNHAPADVLGALIARQTGAASPDSVTIPLVTVEPPVVQQTFQASVRTRSGTGLVRLTFDDGPGGYTDTILDILKRYNVHATFYVIGQNVPRYSGQMQRTVNEGHKVCNHSYSHANLAHLGRVGVQQELSSVQAAIQAATGITPDCMRPPYGAQNATVREVAGSLGLSIDMWSVDPRDWAKPGAGAIKNRVLSGVGPGAVVLLHVLNQQTVDALPGIIEGIRAAGYTLE